MSVLASVTQFVLSIEGPYKWYVLGGVIVALTAVLTRFIFKTIKWFLVLLSLAIIALAIWKYLIL